MRQANQAWKLVTAVLCLCLTVWVWQKGLEDSFARPSVTPKISLRQSEIALMSSSVIPEPFQKIFVSPDPQEKLKGMLQELPEEKLDERQKLLLFLLDKSEVAKKNLVKTQFKDTSLVFYRSLFENSKDNKTFLSTLLASKEANIDPLLFRLSCFKLGGNSDICIDNKSANSFAIRLITSQLLPFLASILGVGFLIRQGWLILKNKTNYWPLITPLPLSLVDMVILISGGFVIIGEVIFPSIFVPIFALFLNNLSIPLRESLKVLIGYTSMTVAPLLILKWQLQGIKLLPKPEFGWLQWRIRPFATGASKAIQGWLMIMPLVLITGLIMNQLVGDQGGSNPLLELVLEGKEIIPLLLLLLTTVVLAPLFEELVFRGVLLPVLAIKLGRFWGVVLSALIFALAHLSVGELPPLFVLGIGLALLRLSSGRLLPCALMHSIWNGVTFSSLLLVGG